MTHGRAPPPPHSLLAACHGFAFRCAASRGRYAPSKAVRKRARRRNPPCCRSLSLLLSQGRCTMALLIPAMAAAMALAAILLYRWLRLLSARRRSAALPHVPALLMQRRRCPPPMPPRLLFPALPSSPAALTGPVSLCPLSIKRGAPFIVSSSTAMEEGQALLSPKSAHATAAPASHLASPASPASRPAAALPAPAPAKAASPRVSLWHGWSVHIVAFAMHRGRQAVCCRGARPVPSSQPQLGCPARCCRHEARPCPPSQLPAHPAA